MKLTIANVKPFTSGKFSIRFEEHNPIVMMKDGTQKLSKRGKPVRAEMIVSEPQLRLLAKQAGVVSDGADVEDLMDDLEGAKVDGIQYAKAGSKYIDQDGNEQERDQDGFVPFDIDDITVKRDNNARLNARIARNIANKFSANTSKSINFDEEVNKTEKKEPEKKDDGSGTTEFQIDDNTGKTRTKE